MLANDKMGTLGLTKKGVRQRDVLVARALENVPSVWLPGGGYHPDSWRVLAGTALVLFGRPGQKIRDEDPLWSRFTDIAESTSPDLLSGGSPLLSEEDFPELFGGANRQPPRLLGFYTPHGVEYALHRYGFLPHLERLGYSNLHVLVDRAGHGDRMRLMGDADGKAHVLIEVVVARHVVNDIPVLFVHWLSLRHPKARFATPDAALPGQEVPGLGMAKEAVLTLGLMAKRLGLFGVAFKPAQFHMAYMVRKMARFVDARLQGRFEALLRDLGSMPLRELTQAIDRGDVRRNAQVYQWEPGEMVAWLDAATGHLDETEVQAARESSRFSLVA